MFYKMQGTLLEVRAGLIESGRLLVGTLVWCPVCV